MILKLELEPGWDWHPQDYLTENLQKIKNKNSICRQLFNIPTSYIVYTIYILELTDMTLLTN